MCGCAGAGDYDPAEDGPPGASGGGGGASGGVQGPGNDDLLALPKVIFIRIWNPEGPSMKFALVGPFMLSQALVLCLELHVYPWDNRIFSSCVYKIGNNAKHLQRPLSLPRSASGDRQRGNRDDFIRTSIIDTYSGSIKIITRLEYISHCKTVSGAN